MRTRHTHSSHRTPGRFLRSCRRHRTGVENPWPLFVMAVLFSLAAFVR